MLPRTGLCLVEPLAFGFNAETALTNQFQVADGVRTPESTAASARAEFQGLVHALRAAGVTLAIASDSAQPVKPDAVFPNNWVSFHADGSVVLYPMHDATRRAERREVVIDAVKEQLGFIERRRVDLSDEERHGRFLEGTGSLVLDHRARVAYACRSPRTDATLLTAWARLMGYEPFLFDAVTREGIAVYHTNVVMWLGHGLAAVGFEWIAPAQREALRARLQATGRKVLSLTDAQLRHFAGNMLEVSTGLERALVMSARAAASLDAQQNAMIRDAKLRTIVAAIPLIETLGGGSVRCMLAEVPLPGAEA